jgi:hypothetical protein
MLTVGSPPSRGKIKMHMRVRLVGMKDQRISMRGPKLIPSQLANGPQNQFRRRPRRHRKDDVVNKFRRPSGSTNGPLSASCSRLQVEIPILDQYRLNSLSAHALSRVRL